MSAHFWLLDAEFHVELQHFLLLLACGNLTKQAVHAVLLPLLRGRSTQYTIIGKGLQARSRIYCFFN